MGSSINVSVFISTVRPLKTMRYWLLAQIMFGSCGVCFTCPLTQGFIPWKSDFSQFIFGFSCFSPNTLLFLSKICFWSRLRVYLAYNILSFVDVGFRGSLFNLIWSFQKNWGDYLENIFSKYVVQSLKGLLEVLLIECRECWEEKNVDKNQNFNFLPVTTFSSSRRSTVGPQNSPSRWGWIAITMSGTSTFFAWMNLQYLVLFGLIFDLSINFGRSTSLISWIIFVLTFL